MAVLEETTYEKVFERVRVPAWLIEYIASTSNHSPESTNRAFFELFLSEHIFICSVCRNEFSVANVQETDLVRCNECRR
jgi:uncharacterized CHY-type Zn-finger protein